MDKKKAAGYVLAGVCLLAVISVFFAFFNVDVDYLLGSQSLKVSLAGICAGKLGSEAAAVASVILLILVTEKVTGCILYFAQMRADKKKLAKMLWTEIILWLAVLVEYAMIAFLLQNQTGELMSWIDKSVISILGPGFWLPVLCGICCICGSGAILHWSKGQEKEAIEEVAKTSCETEEYLDAPYSTDKREKGRSGCLEGINGTYQGARITLQHGEKLMLGRDSQKANLVFDDAQISSCHCCIQYDKNRDYYLVTDYSSHGVYDQSGKRLAKNMASPCARGTALTLGRTNHTFLLE